MKTITQRLLELQAKAPPPPKPSFMERLNLFLAQLAFGLAVLSLIIVVVRLILRI